MGDTAAAESGASTTFDALLRSISELPTIVGQLTTFRPTLGRHHGRIYRSQADAVAYDDGFGAMTPGRLSGYAPGTPYAVGWADAEADWDRASGHSNDRARGDWDDDHPVVAE